MTTFDVYEDHALVEWVDNASRETLELRFMEVVAMYRGKCRELNKLRDAADWSAYARQQERSGGWM